MHIPILPVEAIDDAKPDYILILPWNLKNEIVAADAARRRLGRRSSSFPFPRYAIIDPKELVP